MGERERHFLAWEDELCVVVGCLEGYDDQGIPKAGPVLPIGAVLHAVPGMAVQRCKYCGVRLGLASAHTFEECGDEAE